MDETIQMGDELNEAIKNENASDAFEETNAAQSEQNDEKETTVYDKNKTCCFTGPRTKNFPWKEDEWEKHVLALIKRLKMEIVKAIQNGYRHFISGMAVGVDMYAATIIAQIKECYPLLDIVFEAAVPFPQQADRWSFSAKTTWEDLLSKADIKTIIGQKCSTENFKKRNEYMVDKSSLVIAVAPFHFGGTARTIEYAKNNGKELVLIDPENPLKGIKARKTFRKTEAFLKTKMVVVKRPYIEDLPDWEREKMEGFFRRYGLFIGSMCFWNDWEKRERERIIALHKSADARGQTIPKNFGQIPQKRRMFRKKVLTFKFQHVRRRKK